MRILSKDREIISKTVMVSCLSFFCWISINFVSYVFAQTDNINAKSEKSISRGNNAINIEKPILIKAVISKIKNSDQEKISREAMEMIMEITKTNILYENNKASANLAFEEQKFKDREKHKNEMKKFNEIYNKKYLESFKSFQKMRGQHAGYSGSHYDYSAYLQQFLTSRKR